MVDFFECHAHTEYSNLRLPDCINKVENLILQAKNKGLKGIAITDHESLSGHIKALKNKVDDFKIALGNEIYLCESYENQVKYYHYILIAKNLKGHKQLRELSSKAWQNSFYDRGIERVVTTYEHLENILNKEKGNIIASTGCLGGEFANLVLKFAKDDNIENKKDIDSFIKKHLRLFGDDFYIELQPSLSEEQKSFNKLAIKIAIGYGIKYIITNDVHYINKEDRIIHEAYLHSKEGERELEDFYESTYLKTPEEIKDRMIDYLSEEDILTGINNTMAIFNKIEKYDLKKDLDVPEINFNKEKIELKFIFPKIGFIEKFYNSKFIQDRKLIMEIEKGFISKKQELNDVNINRLNEELGYVWGVSEGLNKRISAYYNTMDKMIDIIWDDEGGNSLVGVARGSITGMYFAYLIDITQINPLKFDLPAWRHIHPSKISMADIDIDSEASKRSKILNSMKREFGEENVLNVCTFKTEGSKSALLTTCRGLNINNDVAQQMADMIPIERGASWSIHDCYYGNEELERKPIKEFIKLIDENNGVLNIALNIEGLVCGRSIHAAGLVIYNNGYVEMNSLMKAPNGQFTTCWNLEDSEYCGNLKFDFLTVENLDKIRETMNLLIRFNKIQWQGSLRNTYNKYLHPDVLDYENEDMWNMIGSGEIIDLFQFSTDIGIQSAKKIKPKTLKEMAVANSIMRLAGENGKESPMEKFVRFKNDISLWYKEMYDYGLNEDEIKVLEKYLKKSYGLSAEQEDVMELSMDKNIANFDVPKADKLRKGIAKKKREIIEEVKKMFLKHGIESGNRKIFLEYVWEYQVMPQASYAFSRNHTIPYSAIGLQNMNLVHRYGSLFWNTACLNINSGSETDLIEDELSKEKNTDYGKIAKAIGEMQTKGIKISLPNINKADLTFYPDENNNSIMFGLKGITSINTEIANSIISNRPYKSLNDFIEKNNLTTLHMINLIKSGAFDDIENIEREIIIKKYFYYMSKKENIEKTSLTMQNMSKIVDLDIIPKQLEFYKKCFLFRKYCNNEKPIKNEKLLCFFNSELKEKLTFKNDYKCLNGDIILIKKSFDKTYKKLIQPLEKWIKDENTINLFNKTVHQKYIEENYNKYCKGSIAKWEMDSISCYFSEHELSNVNISKYNISNFFNILEKPEIYEEKPKYNKYVLYKIMGTVLDKNKYKHTVTLLTPDGVVVVKFYKGQFLYYDKQISEQSYEENKKTVLEKSWFKRGNKLIITGYRRYEQFVAKKYFNSIYQHSVVLIEDIKDDGDLVLKFDREGEI